MDHAPEPLSREHKLVPEAHSLHRVKVVEPELVLLTVGEQLAPHLLQVVEDAMVLLASPGGGFDSLELQRILAVPRLGNLVDDAEVEEIFFHLLFNGPLDLCNEQGHQVGVHRLGILIALFVMFVFLVSGVIKGLLLHVIAMDKVDCLPRQILLINALVRVTEEGVSLMSLHEEDGDLLFSELILQRGRLLCSA